MPNTFPSETLITAHLRLARNCIRRALERDANRPAFLRIAADHLRFTIGHANRAGDMRMSGKALRILAMVRAAQERDNLAIAA